jgi:hypothetical protein
LAVLLGMVLTGVLVQWRLTPVGRFNAGGGDGKE